MTNEQEPFALSVFSSVAERVFLSFPCSERYEEVVRLDFGATSSVWRAHDKQLQLDVAIKVFDRGNRTFDEVLDEARASCAVRSDHVVRVMDVVDDDPPFIVMELVAELEHGAYVVGESAFAQRPRSLSEAVRWVREAALGVHAAHLRSISHRDLKPRNVMIAPISRRAMVTDFGLGIARKHRKGACVVGTPTHMAPEQAAGIPSNLDMRGSHDDRRQLVAIDVFGLGALAFDLVTGNPPYAHDDQRDAAERALISERHPLVGATTAWKRRMPQRLALILEKAMTHDPLARYASAKAFEADLAAWVEGFPTTVDDDSRFVRSWLWVRRDPMRATASVSLAMIFASIVALVVEVSRSRGELAQAREQAAQERRHAEQLEQQLAAARDACGKQLREAKADVP